MNLGSNKLAYLYLPTLAIALCIIATVMDLLAGREVRSAVLVLLPAMSFMLYLGIKKRVWEED